MSEGGDKFHLQQAVWAAASSLCGTVQYVLPLRSDYKYQAEWCILEKGVFALMLLDASVLSGCPLMIVRQWFDDA